MNLGLQHVTTPYILEVDGDDWLDPDAIEVLERRISTLKPNTVYVYGDAVNSGRTITEIP